MTYTIDIPAWHPTKLNDLLGNWRKAARLKKADRKTVEWMCRIWSVPLATGKRRLRLTIVLGKGQRGGDPDCYFKSVADALVACGRLTDDNRQGVELMPVRFERDTTAATRIELEDI